ncbi:MULTISPECIES: hypothetical protein [Streptomyces]|uniref:hypothetical protein n=1 Tax=Streptomyces TaxID=1883 RepID=UPI000BF06351|nr:hypothetical protein [Streptomyces sp. st140]
MADDEINSNESAEDPIAEPAGTPPSMPDTMSWYEATYMTLAIAYYGSHTIHGVWLQMQEQLFPLVQPFL